MAAPTSKNMKGKGYTLPKPNNIITVPSTMDKDFFKWWCMFLNPFIKLTPREVEVVASFLKQRYELSKVITAPEVLDAMLFSAQTKDKILEDCNITLQHLYVIMGNLRKQNIFTETGINPRLIPNIRPTDNCFQLLVLFKNTAKA